MEFDFVIIGAGSAGCAAAKGLSDANVGTVCVLEAGPTDAVPQVKVPFGLLYTMGSGRDWRFKSTAQQNAAGRNLKVNRGRMLGGSSSINSMVWFRGRQDGTGRTSSKTSKKLRLQSSHDAFLIHMPSPMPLGAPWGPTG
jgi:choline dehydrogenase-like flavoprotein